MKADNAREIVKILLMKENISVSKLAEMLSTPQKKMYQQNSQYTFVKSFNAASGI